MASIKFINIHIPKYFMAIRKCINNYIPIVFCTSRGSLCLVAWNEPLIHFATVQLVTPIDNRFFNALLEVPSMFWKRSRPSPQGVFVGRDAVLFD